MTKQLLQGAQGAMMRVIGLCIYSLFLLSCNQGKEKTTQDNPVIAVAAMSEVMWGGKLAGQINLDTISIRKGLYGLGPKSYLNGEILINDGKSYVASVNADSTMTVVENFDVSAPFFVYGYVPQWDEFQLPQQIITLKDLEKHLDSLTKQRKRPFAFKLEGTVAAAVIHIQNLPEGTKVSSPKEAHQGQVNYTLQNKQVTVVGFFSTAHQGIFTHHDSFIHMHLISHDRQQMGHVDELQIGSMKLWLPKE